VPPPVPAPPDPTAAAVGARVRTLREEAGHTLSALARLAGVGKASLSELEQGRRNPTLATLYALAGPLGVPLVALLGDTPGATTDDGALSARLLHVDRTSDDDGTTTTEVYWIELPPGGHRSSPAHPPGVVEHVLVVRGGLTVTVAGADPVDLGPGRSHRWGADVPHAYDGGPQGAAAVDTIVTREA